MKNRKRVPYDTFVTPTPRPIPLVDLAAESAELAEPIRAAIAEVLASMQFVLGPNLRRFEEEFGPVAGASETIAVGSGTDAIAFALRACGVEPGDEVVTTPYTFIATTEAILHAGARPVYADVDPETGLLDADDVARRITPRTRAILPVHLFGQPADLDELSAIARGRGLRLVEDAAQAHGARYGERPVGSFGDAAAFSFYPSKNLGAYGDGGCVTTNDPEIARRVRRLRDHGRAGRHLHEEVGFTSRLDEIQAAVLRVKLPRLQGWNARRRALAARYRQRLRSPARPYAEKEGRESVYHLYAVRVPDREAVAARLEAARVAFGIYYPRPNHLQPALEFLGHREGSFPNAERLSRETIAVPCHPYLRDEDVDRIAELLSG